MVIIPQIIPGHKRAAVVKFPFLRKAGAVPLFPPGWAGLFFTDGPKQVPVFFLIGLQAGQVVSDPGLRVGQGDGYSPSRRVSPLHGAVGTEARQAGGVRKLVQYLRAVLHQQPGSPQVLPADVQPEARAAVGQDAAPQVGKGDVFPCGQGVAGGKGDAQALVHKPPAEEGLVLRRNAEDGQLVDPVFQSGQGAKVVCGARRGDRLQKLASQIGPNALWLEADVRRAEDMEALARLAKEKFGKIDLLFANAGIMPGSNMSQLKVQDWMDMVDVNIKGVLYAIAAVMPVFLAQKKGHIVVTSSVAGTKSVPGNAVYSGTKHFVRAMLDALRTESVTEGTNIRTTTIYPGAIKTELLHTVAPSETKTMVEAFYRDVGLEADAVARAVLYAVTQPDNVDISDLVVRPSREG